MREFWIRVAFNLKRHPLKIQSLFNLSDREFKERLDRIAENISPDELTYVDNYLINYGNFQYSFWAMAFPLY
jgi:hypothetical protein